MATNVFGNPVTDMTLEALPEYEGKTITRYDRAYVALQMKNSENKAVNARAYVDNLKTNFGNGVCTKCLIYNATGEPIPFIRSHDWYGRIGESPYPMEIANGQWGAFLHTKTPSAASGSNAAAVYRLKGLDGAADLDCMMAWCTAWGPWYSNHCYAEIREKDHFDDSRWGVVSDKLNDSGLQHAETNGRFRVDLSIGSDSTSEWEAVVKLGKP